MFGYKSKRLSFFLCLFGCFLSCELWAISPSLCVSVLRGRLQRDPEIVDYYLHKNPKAFERFLDHERQVALDLLLKNVEKNGAVAAASSRAEPDYGYHWRRDGALIYRALWRETKDESLIRKYIAADLEMLQQASPGKAKFNLDLTPYAGIWAEPQNDGPALDLLLLSEYAHFLLNRAQAGDAGYVYNHLYTSNPRSPQLITYQAEYIMNFFDHTNDVEPWEEGWGRHFYNAKVQIQSLTEAANLADFLWDSVAAEQYRKVAFEIQRFLQKEHWDENRKIYRSTVHHPENIYRPGEYDWRKNKTELDIEVLLAYLHTDSRVDDSRLLSTFFELRKAARAEYLLNRTEQRFKYALSMGRYPGDMWDGVNRTGGNPWFISTFAAAEMFFKLVDNYKESKALVVDRLNHEFFVELISAFAPEKAELLSQLQLELHSYEMKQSDELYSILLNALKKAGDEQLMLGLSHTSPDGRIDEQFNGFHGYMQGAQNLSWSYTALLTALRAREKLLD